MPVETCHLDPIGEVLWLRFPHPASRGPEVGVHDNPTDHVEAMQPGQREIDSQKGTFTREEMMLKLRCVLEAFYHKKA